jgi:hypothetical protein
MLYRGDPERIFLNNRIRIEGNMDDIKIKIENLK